MAGLCAMTGFHMNKVPIEHPMKSKDSGRALCVSYKDVHQMVAKTAAAIRQYDPETILCIGGSGYVPARILRTYFPQLPLLSVTIRFYDDVNLEVKPSPEIIQWLDDAAIASYIKGKRVILVDDVDDTGSTMNMLHLKLQDSAPAAVAAFVLHSKQKMKHEQADLAHWFVGDKVPDIWIEYPWDELDPSRVK
eukprot:NODE_6400_length_850_cov_104.266850_g6164_i0.p1 GENE.NODE_6400_length_850_cov_104.266850_g6164_i0~~NODE_6400_length_850_cov_104.266850_g6164_i0.p1  ORF type:complete len:192 (-),score=18.28 NODE_6400_length_850_cov_104.266850_g6164_i0:192-767(-)